MVCMPLTTNDRVLMYDIYLRLIHLLTYKSFKFFDSLDSLVQIVIN